MNMSSSAAEKLQVQTNSKSRLSRETLAFLKDELEPLNKEFQKKTVRLTQLNEENKIRNANRRNLKTDLVTLKAKIAFIESHLSRQ